MSVTTAKSVAIGELSLWDRNPRTISKAAFDQLVKSLREDPDMMLARPLIALPDGRVIAGNMRLRAAQELGWEEVPTVYADLDEQRAQLWALRDNNPYGEWDEQGLAELLYELSQEDVDLSLAGFGEDELKRLLDSVAGPDVPDDRGTDLALADVSIGDPTHVVSAGEVWNVGPHLLVVEPVYDGWPKWVGYLEEGTLLVPYPTPTLPFTERAGRQRLVMIQPDVWLAGHVLDKYAAVRGAETITRAS